MNCQKCGRYVSIVHQVCTFCEESYNDDREDQIVLNTLSDFRKKAEFQQYKGENEISLDAFLELLSKAEKLHEENQWLYGKLNKISNVIEKGRGETKTFL